MLTSLITSNISVTSVLNEVIVDIKWKLHFFHYEGCIVQ